MRAGLYFVQYLEDRSALQVRIRWKAMTIRYKHSIFLVSIYVLVAGLICSCGGKKLTSYEVVKGSWLIEEIVKDGIDVFFDPNRGSQGVGYLSDGSCVFPFLNDNGLEWEYVENSFSDRRIILTRKRNDFRQEYAIVFKVNKRGLLQMEMTSENEYILITKLLFYPKNHTEFIEELLNPVTLPDDNGVM